MRVFISAGEASGDLYAAGVTGALRRRFPDADFFGCAGPRMQAAGVRPVVDSRSLAVAGLVEVVPHIPRIYGEFRKLVRAAAATRPDVAILTDAPDFHLRLAKKLHRMGIPIVYLIAPQAWAWREDRVRTLRATVDRLLCIFPFEEEFFRRHGIPASYIGHPLARIVKSTLTRAQFCEQHGLPQDRPIVAILPGSRHGEAARHMPALIEAMRRISAARQITYVLALPPGFGPLAASFWERIRAASIQDLEGQVVEGETWELLAHSEVALAASGTVTIEAALLDAPMVTFYRVNALSWILGRWLVKAPFLSMVNLVAGRKIVPELIQGEMTGQRISREAIRLLEDGGARETMRAGLREVAERLSSDRDPMEAAAEWIERIISSEKTVPAGS